MEVSGQLQQMDDCEECTGKNMEGNGMTHFKVLS